MVWEERFVFDGDHRQKASTLAMPMTLIHTDQEIAGSAKFLKAARIEIPG